MGNGTELHRQQPPYKLLIKQHQAPGDVLVLTATIEALKRQYPGRYRVKVDTTCQEIWWHNPHIEDGLVNAECFILEANYNLIQRCGQEPVHFLQGYTEDVGRKLGVPLRLDTNRPSIYLSDAEKEPFPDAPRPYVVVNAGHKMDFTTKFAGSSTFQQIVDAFRGTLNFVQVGEQNPSHIHKPLSGVVNLVGKTSARQLFRLVHGSVAGVGPVSFLHHVYAAFQKPYVCYLGGREEASWEGYNTATMLSTLGQLSCCKERACWRSRTVHLHDGQDKSLCEKPFVNEAGETVPMCMNMLGAEAAIKALKNMIRGGIVELGTT